MKEKKRGSSFLKHVIPILVGIGLGIVLGLLLAHFLPEGSDGRLYMLLLLGGLVVGLFVQTVVHEFGHLVCGLLSGYRFVSFRVGSLMLYRGADGYRLARFSIAGTAGQCLLSPPALQNGKIPVILYNLGGVLMNLVFSAILFLLVPVSPIWLRMLLLPIGAVGILMALTNGIPMKTGTVNNDGSNAWHLSRSPLACRAFWVQLQVNALQMRGMRLGEMEEEWFARPVEGRTDNSMIATLMVLRCNRYMDMGLFEEADREMKWLLEGDSAVVEIHKGLLWMDRIYCALIRGSDPDGVLNKWNDRTVLLLRRSMKNSLSVLRVQYAYALLYEKNATEATRLKALFDRVAAKYPYEGEMAPESALMALADRVNEQNTHKNGEA